MSWYSPGVLVVITGASGVFFLFQAGIMQIMLEFSIIQIKMYVE